MRRLAALLALLAIGLGASLLPPVEFVRSSVGGPVDTTPPVWPAAGVQQDLGPLDGPVSQVDVWVSAEPGSAWVRVNASLVTGPESRPVRQYSFEAVPGQVAQQALKFPPYAPAAGERLRLQMQVAPDEHDFVTFGVGAATSELDLPTLNTDPLDVGGPLAFELIQRSSGLRAALVAGGTERVRLIGALLAVALATVLWPPVAARLRPALIATARRIARTLAPLDQLMPQKLQSLHDPAPIGTGGRDWPRPRWFIYPWLIAVFPILHYLSANALQFEPSEVVAPGLIALGGVTVTTIALRIVLGDFARPTGLVTIAAVAFFGYGHLFNALGPKTDHGLLLGLTISVATAAALLVVRNPAAVAPAGRYLNYASVALVAIPTVSLVLQFIGSGPARAESGTELNALSMSEFVPDGIAAVDGEVPDIYYFIFDAYGRHDALGTYDNTPFVEELTDRGFYVAGQANSNYMYSRESISSSLNMSYLDRQTGRSGAAMTELFTMAEHHVLGRILKQLGYAYVHVSSGYDLTDESPIADLFVEFSPTGTDLRGPLGDRTLAAPVALPVFGRFTREFVRTTILRPFLPDGFSPDASLPYAWWHPDRALKTFEFLSLPLDIGGAKFVFAHIMKPHTPTNFDRHGNIAALDIHDGFTDEHDPSVPDAYTGQLMYVNGLILDMVDAVLANSKSPPIIVLSADHGRRGEYPDHPILAAYHVPDQVEQSLYPSITSVNSFRVILDAYFDLGLGLLDDKVYTHDDGSFNFREIPRT